MRPAGWLVEPAIAVGILGVGTAVWWTDYVTKNNTGEPGMLDLLGFDALGAVVRNTGFTLIPALAWLALAALGGWLLRRRRPAWRIVAGLSASVIICVPIAIVSAIQLNASDGWQGIGVIGVAFPIAGIFVMLVPQSIGRLIMYLASRPPRPLAAKPSPTGLD